MDKTQVDDGVLWNGVRMICQSQYRFIGQAAENTGQIIVDCFGEENCLALFQLIGIIDAQNLNRTCTDWFILQLIDFLTEMILTVQTEIDDLSTVRRPLCEGQEVIDESGFDLIFQCRLRQGNALKNG